MYQQIAANKRKTAFLIMIFIAFILAIGFLIDQINNTGYFYLILATIFSIPFTLISYYSGDKVALMTSGARKITKEENAYVYNLVENLCLSCGLNLPQIYLIDDQSPNAFACGRDPKHASIALTTGLINSLENQELEGVIAHELSHIKNYDIRLMTIVIILVGLISLLANFMWRTSLGTKINRDKKNNENFIFLLIGAVLIILSPIIAEIIKLAISRQREFLADASGALITRYPEGLASALEKIDQSSQPLQKTNSATAHLYIANPFGKKSFMTKLFSTHPPITERIQRLRQM